jgi:catechol 2,3-dioxygenase-like lactoylglutathione lyase family enzyme
MSGKPAVLNQLNIVVRDIRASADFYRRLGCDVPLPEDDAKVPPFRVTCGLGNDFDFDLDVENFAQVWNAAWKRRDDLAGKVVVGFHVDSRARVDEIYEDLTGAGYRALQPAHDAFWGARYAIVEDPNGVAVGIMSPSDPDRRHWPPEGWTEGA